MPGLKGRFFERRKETRKDRREEFREEKHERKPLSSSSGFLKSRPLISWLNEREPLIGNREKLLFGIPRTTPDPLPPGMTPAQAVAAVESTSWAKGLAEGVCKAAGLTGPPYDQCVTNYKRKVALGALGLTTAQLTPEISAAPKRRGPGRPLKTPEEVPTEPTPTPAAPPLHGKHEKQEHWQEGKKHGNWIADIYMEIKRDNKIFFTGDPARSGTKLVVFEKDSGNSYVSRPLSIQELDYIVRQIKKDKALDIGVYGSPIEGAKNV